MVFYFIKQKCPFVMNNLKILLYIIPFLIFSFAGDLIAQRDVKNPTPSNESISVSDYKIVSSDSRSITVDFTPQYNSTLTFLNSGIENFKPGSPQLSQRIFPVFLPVSEGNRIELLDYKYRDIQNIEVNPVPEIVRGKGDMSFDYNYQKDNGIYSTNTFFPKDPGELVFSGSLRNKYFGAAIISPLQYNPVTRTLRRYEYIRFRIIFGGSPVKSNRIISKEAYSFFSNTGLNWKEALNWSTVQFNENSGSGISNSVLANGDFYKIEINETGIYKIDKTLLESVGINTSAIDPRTLKLYGNGGTKLPFKNSDPVPEDLIENSIFVYGGDDGSFDNGDYILFFGRSVRDVEYNYSNQKLSHYNNPFSNSNYYFLTYGGNLGLRMEIVQSPNQPNVPEFTSFPEIVWDDPDVNNLGATGTLWFSQRIGLGESYIANNTLHGYSPGSEINLEFNFGNASSSTTTFKVSDGAGFNNITQIGGVGGEFAHINAYTFTKSYSLPSGNLSVLKLEIPTGQNTSTASAYVDWYDLNYDRTYNSAVNNVFHFRSPDLTGMGQYKISTFSSPDIRIFDVSENFNSKIIVPISYSNGIAVFQSNHNANYLREYFAIGGDNYLTPKSISQRIDNQNLRGITEGATFIIISPKDFMEAAYKLKQHRETPGVDYIKTIVIDIDQIYNEFSGGLLDPVAIRNFLKHAFYNWSVAPFYVMFLGDGTYDFRNIYNVPVRNWLPPIQTDSPNVDEVVSYPSDDFFIEFNENYVEPQPGKPDMATGRLCVNSLDEANNVVQKIIEYESGSNNGIWKKTNMYVADDGWTTSQTGGGEGNIHTFQSEIIAENMTPPDFEKQKIYIVTYPTTVTPQGRRKPQANEDIINGWNEGRLVINYVGHGSTDLWAHEQIFERQTSIPRLVNKGKYPFVTIPSCDLARFDDPFSLSAGEELVNIRERGAIGVLAASRPVYSSPNAAFNEAVWNHFMNLKDTLNLPIRIGKSIYLAKQLVGLANSNSAKFFLLSDPTVRVDIPQYFTVIDSINNYTGSDTAEIKALQKVKLSGRILYPDSTFWNTFNGSISIKVFDVERHITYFDFGIPFRFRLDGGKLFTGNTTVENGLWTIEFVVPKDISYATGNGKILAYFNNQTTDGSGYSNKFILNGLDTNAPIDTVSPEIGLFLGDRNFRSGDIVNQNTKIIADFYDESGINLTGTIGHKIEAMLNNDPDQKIDLTNYYNSTSNYQNGTLEYPLTNLIDGDYNLKVTAWDTYNNSASETISFRVSNNSELVLADVYNYPNPMRDKTEFMFQHNFDSNIDVEIKIYTVSGRMIKELNQLNITDKFVSIPWDGRDNDGDAIANGTYIYRITIKTQSGDYTNTTTGKIAVLN